MKMITALAALALAFAGPAAAAPEIRDPLPLPAPDPALMEALRAHAEQSRAAEVCRVTADIRLFNPFGGMWAAKGSYIKAVAAGPSDDWNGTVLGVGEYAHLVKDCGLGRMAQFAGHSSENQGVRASAVFPSAEPVVGGPVYVRSHTRCNGSKCWPVQAYTRSR